VQKAERNVGDSEGKSRGIGTKGPEVVAEKPICFEKRKGHNLWEGKEGLEKYGVNHRTRETFFETVRRALYGG